MKTKKPSYEYDIQCSCTCLYVMFDFITKVTLNNDILIFVHHKSMNIKLIQIIMDAIVSPEIEQSFGIDFAFISTIFLLDFGTDLDYVFFNSVCFLFVFLYEMLIPSLLIAWFWRTLTLKVYKLLIISNWTCSLKCHRNVKIIIDTTVALKPVIGFQRNLITIRS